MIRQPSAVCCLVLTALLLPSVASAHYLWVTVQPDAGEHGTATIYFEGGPSPGDGHYLDPFVKRGKTWIRTVDNPKPRALEVEEVVAEKKKQRWLTAALPADRPRSIDSYGQWGVYRYGKTDVLLHYYAKNIEASDLDSLHALARAEQQLLDIVPHHSDGRLELTVLWQGKPAAGRPVSVRGPKGFRGNPQTDDSGKVTIETEQPGRYIFRTSVDEPQEDGTFEGKAYQLKRHHATLLLTLPVGP